MPEPSARPDRDLVTQFTKALCKLGEAGQPDAASKLASQAWWGLKDTDPRGAERQRHHALPGPPAGHSGRGRRLNRAPAT